VKVLVYVEGPSDKYALAAPLRPIVEAGAQKRIGIQFIATGGKDLLLNNVARRAADHLSENPDDWVFALPELYPMERYHGTSNQHGSLAELRTLLYRNFKERAGELKLSKNLRDHFRVHCLKHDLEALLLAAVAQLRKRLGTNDRLLTRWKSPVEDQNDSKPPKRIVEAMFTKYLERDYQETIDAPWILQRAALDEVLRACPQCFTLFVAELRPLVS